MIASADLAVLYAETFPAMPEAERQARAAAVVATLYGAAAELATLDAAWGEVFRRHYDRERERERDRVASAESDAGPYRSRSSEPVADRFGLVPFDRFGRWTRIRWAVREALDEHVRRELDR